MSGCWDEQLGRETAAALGVELTSEHWQVIWAVRTYYDKSRRSPSMRPLVKLIKNQVGPELGNSITLTHLFPSPTSGCVAKISGLPKPSDCL